MKCSVAGVFLLLSPAIALGEAITDASAETSATIADPTCTIQVHSPNGGEIWTMGSTVTASWTSSGTNCPSQVRLQLYKAGVATATWPNPHPSSGSKSIPLGPGHEPGSDYRFRISDWSNSQLYDESDGVFAIAATPPNGGSCSPSSTAACLGSGRFKAEISWRDYAGRTGTAQTVPFGTDDSALFWFFSADNWEMLVKVIDGCSLNDRFWVYSAASTDVEYTLTVTDTATGARRTYTNLLGQAALANTDSSAFATCNAQAAAAVESISGPITYAQDVIETLRQPDLYAQLLEAEGTAGACIPSDQEACLEGGRFSARITWRDYAGHTGAGHAVPFGSSNSGLFWFFNSDNWEMLVKVVDGCALNGQFWVFAAATTDVEYRLTITDSFTGSVRTYENSLGERSPAITDTAAFATCAAAGTGRLELVTAPSIVLDSAGQGATIEVRAIDAYGTVVPGASIAWTTSDPEIASVSPSGSLRARVIAQSSGPGSAQILAKWGSFEARTDVLLATTRPGTVSLSSDLILSRTKTHVSLRRNSLTESLFPGQILVSSGRWALIDRIETQTIAASTVELTVVPASYPEAFEDLTIESQGSPSVFVARLRGGGESYADLRDASGRVQRMSLPTAEDFAHPLVCRFASGVSAPVQIVGPDIQIIARLIPHAVYRAWTRELSVWVDGSVQVQILSGEVRFSAVTSQEVSCSLSLGSIPVATAWVYGIGLSLNLKPVVEVRIQESAGALVRLTGPVASAVGTVTGGLHYSSANGWTPFSNRSFSGSITPATLSLETPSLNASIEASAGAEVSIDAYLGIPGGNRSLAEFKFFELEGYGKTALRLPLPLAPSSPSYAGPSWSSSLGVRADLGLELSSGDLLDLLDILGITVAFGDSYPLFDYNLSSKSSPTFSISSDLVEVSTGESLLLSGAGTALGSGSLEFWSRKNSTATLSPLADGSFSSGTGSAGFSPSASQVGSHRIEGRLRLDGISSIFPYASQNELLINVHQGTGTMPSITSVSPNPVPGSAAPQTITIEGANFLSGATVTLWNLTSGGSIPRTSTFISSPARIPVSSAIKNATAMRCLTSARSAVERSVYSMRICFMPS